MITLRAMPIAGLVVLALTSGASLALEASDTMASWKGAPTADKAKLVTELLKKDGREASTSRVVKCLDAASAVPGHADLPISQVVEACVKDEGEPV